MKQVGLVAVLFGVMLASQCWGSDLHDAVKAGDITKVTQLLELGTSVNARDECGLTALRWACRVSRLELVRLLLERGADPNIADTNGETPLHSAAGNGDLEIIRALIDSKANVNARDKWGNTPLHAAAKADQLEAFLLLCAHGADLWAKRTKDGLTPLQVAGGRVQAHARGLTQAVPVSSSSVEPAPPASGNMASLVMSWIKLCVAAPASRDGLEGLTECGVVVEVLRDEAKSRTSLTEEDLETALRAALIRTGRITPIEKGLGASYLYLNVNIVPVDDWTHCAYSVDLELMQGPFLLQRGPDRYLWLSSVATWSRGFAGIAPNGEVKGQVRYHLEELVDRLLVDWQEANPTQ